MSNWEGRVEDFDLRVEGITPTEISRPPLAQGSVAYVGEAVSAVVAISEAIAADACEMVEVDYEPLPPLSDLASAADENAPLLHPRPGSNIVLTIPSGNPAEVRSALEQADVAVTVSQHYPRVACSPIEGIAGLVVPSGDRVVVHVNSQMPALTHDELASTLALPDDQISVGESRPPAELRGIIGSSASA